MTVLGKGEVGFREGLGKPVIRSHGCRENMPLDVYVVSGEALVLLGCK